MRHEAPAVVLDGAEAQRLAALAEGVPDTLARGVHTQQGEDNQTQATPRPRVADAAEMTQSPLGAHERQHDGAS